MGAPSIAEPEVVSPDPEPTEPVTETPETTEPVVEESAAPEEPEAAAEPRVSIDESKYVTREELERERQAAAQAAIEADRKNRQSAERSREQRERRERERKDELKDTLAAAFVSKGYAAPDDDALATAVERSVRKSSEHLTEETLHTVNEAWDYFIGKSDDRPDSPATKLVGDRLQAFTDQIRPLIEAKAREGYVADAEVAEKVKKAVEADRAARNARAREGEEDIRRVDGSPSSTVDRSLEAVTNRIIGNNADDEDKRIWNERFRKGQ